MTNADIIRSMSDEKLAWLLAHETFRVAEIVWQKQGYGFTEEFIYAKRLKWLKEEVGADEK